jgi:hypothetical protein
LADFDNIQTFEAEELVPKTKKSTATEETSQVALKDEKLKPKKNLKPIL